MSEKRKDGGATLLQEEHFTQINPWNKPVVGWKSASEGVGGLVNPMGWGFMRVVLWKKAEDGKKIPLYDQPIIVENPGSIVIVKAGDKIGLIQNYRMTGERLFPDAGAGYIKRLDDEKRWGELIESLGNWSWEAPRGLTPPMEEDDKGQKFEAFILKTAKLEALEEAGFKITNARIAGKVNVNTTFFPHAQYVVLAELDSLGESKNENLEIIGGTKFFSMKELRALNNEGKFDDGLTLSALALCGMSI